MTPQELSIVYEDADLIAVNKPAGLLVIPGRGAPDPSLNQILEARIGQKIFVVHRIDGDASGLVLFAKNAEAHRHLSVQFEKRETQKIYLVLVQGEIEERGEILAPLKSFGSGRVGVDPSGKASATEYWIKERLPGATLLEVRIVTGRRHQIRAHFYHIGHPVLGDRLYGTPRPVGGAARLMLHAHRLTFAKPTGEALTITADLPETFKNIITAFKKQKSS